MKDNLEVVDTLCCYRAFSRWSGSPSILVFIPYELVLRVCFDCSCLVVPCELFSVWNVSVFENCVLIQMSLENAAKALKQRFYNLRGVSRCLALFLNHINIFAFITNINLKFYFHIQNHFYNRGIEVFLVQNTAFCHYSYPPPNAFVKHSWLKLNGEYKFWVQKPSP